MSVFKKPGSPYWYYEFQIDGLRFRGSTKTTDQRAAKAIEAKLRTEAALSRHFPKKPVMSLNEAFGRYYEDHGKRLASARVIDYQLAALLARLGKSTLLSEVTDARIAEYISRRRAEVGDSTVNRELTMLRAVLHMAADQWGIDVGAEPVHWRKHFLREPAERRRHLSVDEEARLMEALREDIRPLVKFCLLTGVRVSNAIMLTWGQVNFGDRTIAFKIKSKRPGGDNHILPMTNEIMVLLANQRGRHEERVFVYECRKKRGPRQRGQLMPFTEGGWRREWGKALAAAGIEDFRFHDLRHTAATRMLKATGNLATVKKVLGHQNIQTTMRYAHVEMEDMRAAMEAAGEQIPQNPRGKRTSGK